MSVLLEEKTFGEEDFSVADALKRGERTRTDEKRNSARSARRALYSVQIARQYGIADLSELEKILAAALSPDPGMAFPQPEGEEIPLSTRILAVADAFDALTSVRSCREAYSIREAQEVIRQEAGERFDPAVKEAFLRIPEARLRGLRKRADALSSSRNALSLFALRS